MDIDATFGSDKFKATNQKINKYLKLNQQIDTPKSNNKEKSISFSR